MECLTMEQLDVDSRLVLCHSRGNGMSLCDGCECHALQKTCPYYVKATHADRCTFLTFGEYCYHTGAQATSRQEYY
jgi:hypothetical protein